MTIALVTGQIRHEELTRDWGRKLLTLLEEETVAAVIVATWHSEKMKTEWFGELVRHPSFVLLAEEELSDPGPGHIWAQSLSLEIGLGAIPSEDIVIKVRTDVEVSLDYLRMLGCVSNWCGLTNHVTEPWRGAQNSLESMDCELVRLNSVKFCSGKIWVPWVDITKPLYIADEIFVSSASRMRDLVVYGSDLPDGIQVDSCPSHIKRFLPVAIRCWAGFLTYARYFGESLHGQQLFGALQFRRIRSPIYSHFLSEYYKFLLRNFEIGFSTALSTEDSAPIRFREWLPSPSPPVPPGYCLCRPSSKHSWGRNRTYIYDSVWLRAMISGASDPATHNPNCQLRLACTSIDVPSFEEFELAALSLAQDERKWLRGSERWRRCILWSYSLKARLSAVLSRVLSLEK